MMKKGAILLIHLLVNSVLIAMEQGMQDFRVVDCEETYNDIIKTIFVEATKDTHDATIIKSKLVPFYDNVKAIDSIREQEIIETTIRVQKHDNSSRKRFVVEKFLIIFNSPPTHQNRDQMAVEITSVRRNRETGIVNIAAIIKPYNHEVLLDLKSIRATL